MNALSKADAAAVPPVFAEGMQDYYREVMSFQRAHAKRQKRLSKVVLAICLAEALVIGGLTVTLAEIAPTVRIVPVFLWARADGTIENAATPSSLPASLDEAQQRAALWQYVRLRESYSAVEESYRYAVVSAMSSDDVRAHYQRTHNAQYPDAPINRIGDRGVVRVSFVSGTWIGSKRYMIRFDRTVELGNERPTTKRWVATLGFSTDAPVRAMDRITFNGAGLVVTDYPGAEAEGAAP